MLELRQVSRTLSSGKSILAEISFRLEAGETLAVIGASATGKSSLLRLIAGLDHPSRGEILWRGETIASADGKGVPPERRGFAMVFQDLALFPHLNVRENVGFGLHGAVDQAQRLQNWLEFFGLIELGRRKTHALSGGEKQRVALARSLATEPELLLLDEPFSGIDRLARHDLVQRLREIISNCKMNSILVTHDARDAIDLGVSVVMFLNEGRAEFFGPIAEALARPENDRCRRFLDASLSGFGRMGR